MKLRKRDILNSAIGSSYSEEFESILYKPKLPYHCKQKRAIYMEFSAKGKDNLIRAAFLFEMLRS